MIKVSVNCIHIEALCVHCRSTIVIFSVVVGRNHNHDCNHEGRHTIQDESRRVTVRIGWASRRRGRQKGGKSRKQKHRRRSSCIPPIECVQDTCEVEGSLVIEPSKLFGVKKNPAHVLFSKVY